MKTLTTDQMITLLKTLTIFIENRDPFTTENIVNELKRDGDQLNGFYYDNGNSAADDYYEEIDDAIDNLILQFFPDFVATTRTVYIHEPNLEKRDIWKDEYDEEEELFDDVNVDKEGNKLPIDNANGVYDDTKEEDEEEDRGAGWYKDPATGEWMWDRDAAETARMEEDEEFFANYGKKAVEEACEDPNYELNNDYNVSDDHEPEYELTVDKQKRINIGKKILVNKVGYNENEKVIVIADKDGKNFYIISANDDSWGIGEDEWVVGEYQLKNGALRIGLGTIISDIQSGDKMYLKIHWPVMCTDDNLLYIHIYSK